MKQRLPISILVAIGSLAAASAPSSAAVLAAGPDAWSRGTSANDGTFASVYYGWDLFDPGTPGAFGNSTLDDSTPDIGVDPGGASAVQSDPGAYGLRSSTGNLYSGFQGDALGIDLTLPSNGSAGSGSTTILLTLIGNPANDRQLLPFTLSDGIQTFAPDTMIDGDSAELSLGGGSPQHLWIAEWQLAGNTSRYALTIASDLASGNGTDVAIDSLAVDIAWRSDASPLSNQFSNIEFIPEPGSGTLALAACLTFILRRARRTQM